MSLVRVQPGAIDNKLEKFGLQNAINKVEDEADSPKKRKIMLDHEISVNAKHKVHVPLTKNSKSTHLMLVMTGEKFRQCIPYPIIVESWNKKKEGRRKRQWLEQFTQTERNKISKYHGRFYRWYLVTGTPKHVSCSPNTIDLLIKAVNFFASI